MSMTPPATSIVAERKLTAVPRDQFARTDGRLPRKRPLMRKYEVAHLAQNGDIADFSRIAPANQAFENSFASLARGSLVQTSHGQTAVEDLYPGDQVHTVEDGLQTLLWRGTMTIVPGAAGQSPDMGCLTRISADALGIARPLPDLILGPKARIFSGNQAARTISRGDGIFAPARDYLDGINVIELTPPSAVQVYQLGFADQQRVVANGVEIESQHPGTLHELGLRGEMLALYMSLFPHMEDIASFGPLRHPRLRIADLDLSNLNWGVA